MNFKVSFNPFLKSLAHLGAHWDQIQLSCGARLKRKKSVCNLSLYSRCHLNTAQAFVSARVKILCRRNKDYFGALSERLTLCGISLRQCSTEKMDSG